MQKQLKKFGFFSSKNSKNVNDAKIDDKLVKYLYKNETGIVGKLQKRKTKSPKPQEGDGNAHKHKSKKHQTEEEVRKDKHRKHSKESVHRKHRSSHPFASHTEMYYISPEDVKRHRKKSHKSKETYAKEEKVPEVQRKHKNTPPDCDPESVRLRNKRKQTAEDIVKFITEHNFKGKDSEDMEDYQWLTKKEIFNLINNSKCLPQNASSNLLKKFFVFDKQHSMQDKMDFINVANEFSKALKRYKDDNTNAIFIPVHSSEPSPVKKVEKERKDKESEVVEPAFSRKSSKHHKSRSRDIQNGHKHVSDINLVAPSPKNTKRKIPKQEQLNATHKEVEKINRTKPKSKSFVIPMDSEKDSDHVLMQAIKPKVHRSKHKNSESSEINVLEQSASEVLLKSKVNPERHRRCLVKNTFSIVQIPPTHLPSGHLEKKKKSKPFKKYYRYDNYEDQYEAKTETYHTYSDSNKMYQDMSDASMGESPRKRYRSRSRGRKHVPSELKAETHISAVTITPKYEKPLMKKSQSKDCAEKSESAVRKSKIPILSNTSRIVASLKKTLSPRSCRGKPIDSPSFSPRSDKEKSVQDVPVVNTKLTNKTESMKEEVSKPKPLRSQSQNANPRSLNVKPIQEKVAGKKESRVSAKPARERINIEPLKGSKPVKNSEAVNARFSNIRTCDKAKTVAGAKEKVPRSKSPQFLPVRQLKAAPPKAKENVTRTSNITRRSSVESKFSRMSATSTVSKQSKKSSVVDKKGPARVNRNRLLSASPPPTFRRRSADASLTSSQFGSKSPSRVSTAGSVWSRSSRKSNLASKSDTKLQQKQHSNAEKKVRAFARSSSKASLSNSTFGEKSLDSALKGTSFFLTKTYKDDDKLSRWQKQKVYSDTVRKKNQKATVAPQVVEVRYLTVSNGNNDNYSQEESLKFEDGEMTKLVDIKSPPKSTANEPEDDTPNIPSTKNEKVETAVNEPKKDFFEDDLPQPCIEIIENQKFNELFQLPVDKALNEILHENYNFLKKDFSFPFQAEKYASSDDDLSSLSGELYFFDKKFDEWYDFTIKDEGSITEISCANNLPIQIKDELNVGSQDHIVDSCSAPGSEESGYSTIKSRPISKSFFERPEIKALLNPPTETLDSYCIEVQIEAKSSSNCGLDIRSIQSKSLQTVVECSQKSVQIKMSEEEIRTIDLDGETDENEGKGGATEMISCEVQTEELTKETPHSQKELATNEENKEQLLVDDGNSECEDSSSSEDSVKIPAITIKTNSEEIKVKKKRSKKKFNLSFLSCIMCAPEEE